jgi:hypothetical protein
VLGSAYEGLVARGTRVLAPKYGVEVDEK